MHVNLQELIVALQGVEAPLSPELELLLKEGLHPAHLPPALQPKAAEAFQMAFEAWGGIPRLLLFADRYPGAFLKLYARQIAPTIAPCLPPTSGAGGAGADLPQWPEWLTARRLAYQEITQQQPVGETNND